MGNIDVDIVDARPALREHGFPGLDEDARRELEDLAAVHLHELVGILEAARPAARQPQMLPAGTVGAKLEREETCLV